ncbi:non-ribosomal peptide synthetase [Luteimonas kalidii]|uniref:Amino acid adenylation domain-containing protein n=1 Tax=Luteimonas kalidii TaxID=3042025 RepID=A0ABT6JVF0_9GAMM|nr:non-ribosomal peptide synthetase [Luteimonas kalidii]MDH5833931.1 amino acid adenylation domain-containing protein [Luteimonas kalidii]
MSAPAPSRAAAVTPVDYDPFAGGTLARVAPTTEPQRELWLASQLGEDASLAYNESVSLQLRGPLDVARLRQALQAVVDRHDALRAGFGPDGETFCVLDTAPLPLPLTDLSTIPAHAREATLAEHRRLGVETPFALQQGRLFRAELLRLDAHDHVLLMHAHHIVCDGWSWWVLVRELGTVYAQGAEALPAAEPYADYALAEALHPQGPDFRRDEAYWLSQFAGPLPVLELPTDRPRPARRTFASRREDHVLDATLVSAIRRMGARRGASLFATLLGAFATVVSRLAGQDQVVVGIPAAGQSVDGHEDLVGHCVNLLPLKFDLAPDAGFAQVVDGAQMLLLDAIEHQRYTFGTLLRKLHVPRDPARAPLVNVMFNIDQALDQERSGFPGLALDFTTNARSFENFELSINAVQVEGRLRLETQYNTDLFDAATVRRWLGAFETLLRAACETPEEPVSRLPLVDRAQFDELASLQPAPVAFDRACLMHERFEAQCDRTPARIALYDGAARIDYATLDARANRIAHLLRRHGVQAGALVGLALDRGTDMLGALLGILKAGAGYVPLDPQFPAERLAYMAGDAGLAALVTQRAHAQRFDLRGRPVLALDDPGLALDALPSARLARDAGAASPESPAYVIYTSGSTGRPKGVQVPHRAVSNFIASMQSEPGLGEDDRLLAVTTLSFDIAVLELMLPLSVGAAVVLAGKDTVVDGFALLALLEDSGATAMQATPAGWRLLLEAGWQGRAGFKAMCGGEPLPADLARDLLPRCGELWNLYGPTETTVWSTATRVLPAPDAGPPDIHIGRPIANTQVWILDAHGQPCPRGVPGEICIGGEGVSLGYLARPELTAERFLRDAFADPARGFGTGVDAPLLYRTGDRGRWRPDGHLEHQGRLDFQVKVRGYRIELGEIESQLLAHSGIARAVALAREDRPGDVRLVAYLVPAPGQAPSDADVLSHLRQHLPDYMVPQHLVRLPAIPLLPNGKVDRKALPAPSTLAGDASVATSGIAAEPTDALQAQVLGAMRQVLGRPELALDHGFFESGGHSLLAAQLCARLTRETGTPLSLRQLFEAPTARGLADVLRAGESASGAGTGAAPVIPRRADSSRAPLTPMQQRLWVLEQMEPGGVTWNTPSAHRLRGPMDEEAFARAFDEMVRRQAVLRTIIVEDGDGPMQQVLDAVEMPLLPPLDLSHLPEPERMAALMADLEAQTAEPFVLDRAPLFRARLYRLGDDDHVLYFMTHHVIWDGWSFDILYAEMSALYEAFAAGRPSPLPALETSYGDYAAWHAQALDGDAMGRQLRHWAQHLEGVPEPLHLPEDLPRPARASGVGGTGWVHVDAGTTEALRQVGTRAGATLFMTLLAAYYVLLHRLGGQRDLVVGLPFRNRPSEALERVMGFFVNMLPLRRRLDPAMPFLQLVEEVRKGVVEAFEYPDVPFEHLVRELKIPRDPARSPVYQAVFSFQDVRARNLSWGALQHEHLLMFQKGMANDLGLWFLEHPHGLSGAMGYNADIITPEGARAIGDRFGALLRSLCQQPTQAIGDANLLSDADRARLAEWNSTARTLPPHANLDAMLQARARLAPEAAALRTDDAQLSYAALHARASRIAAALQARGVRPRDRVGVCLERTPDLVATLLAVWRAGAAYVPLDPAYPADRLAYMVEDAGLAQVVAEGTLADPLGLPRDRLLLLDADAREIAGAPDTPAGADAIGLDAPAYVIYTSGSTGKPKGVVVPHGAALNFLDAMREAPGLDAGDRLLAVTTTSFDISVLELFLPLATGATIVLASREQAADGVELAALAAREAVTVLQATPSTWHLLLEADWRPAPGLRALCGGEPMSPDLAARLLERGVELWNMYGPTETTVWSTCARVHARDGQAPDIHIGRPVANTTVWILDPRGQPCPPGVSGELCIGGAGVTLGYHARESLTAEKFIADTVAPQDHGTGLPPRLYRTGDRARWRHDGVLEHQGRMDFQVKIRGHRIELGEIESVLEAQPQVARAVAVVREDQPGDQRLVAYVVSAAAAPAEAALLAALRQALPAYMVPQHVLVLDALPLLPNGKVDRKSLPAPSILRSQEGTASRARSRHEDARVRYLMDLWIELLAVEVAPQDNFFDLGGHSMLAAKMASRVSRETGHRIRLMPLATQTLAHLAVEIPLQSLPDAALAPQPGAGAAPVAEATSATVSSVRDRPGFFGRDGRRLFGMLHGDTGAADATPALLVPAPLLQEGVVCQRALWTVCDTLAAAGGRALRFDWYGSGESAGDALELSLDGMRDDLRQAQARLGGGRVRVLALRSACLPALAAVAEQGGPVDLVLWDPVLSGAAMLGEWRAQHRVQLTAAGRYLREGRALAREDELHGFDVAPALLADLEALDFTATALPRGSRVRVLTWAEDAGAVEGFVQAQRGAGIDVAHIVLQADDRPDWRDASRFEAQVFPRRTVAEVASLIQDPIP